MPWRFDLRALAVLAVMQPILLSGWVAVDGDPFSHRAAPLTPQPTTTVENALEDAAAPGPGIPASPFDAPGPPLETVLGSEIAAAPPRLAPLVADAAMADTPIAADEPAPGPLPDMPPAAPPNPASEPAPKPAPEPISAAALQAALEPAGAAAGDLGTRDTAGSEPAADALPPAPLPGDLALDALFDPTALPAGPLPDPQAALQAWPAVTEWTVQKGDIIKAIADRFTTTVRAIVRLNGLPNGDALSVGEVLRIPVGFQIPLPPIGP